MKVEQIDDGLMIVPETAFESKWMMRHYGKDLRCFVKTGLTVRNLMGIKIVLEEPEPKETPNVPS